MNTFTKSTVHKTKSICHLENQESLLKNDKTNENNKKDEYPDISYLDLYKFSSRFDKFLLLLGVICCVLAGICKTSALLTYGAVTGVIVNYVSTVANNTNATEIVQIEERYMNDLIYYVIACSLFAFGLVVSIYAYTLLFNYAALKQTFKIRELFLRKILNQDIAWYDVNQTGDFASRISDDLKKIEDGIGDKAAIFLFYISIVAICSLSAIIKGWKFALVSSLLIFPIQSISVQFIGWISAKLAKKEINANGAAGAVAEEVLSSIRTVIAFGGQEKEEERYNKHLLIARKINTKRAFLNGIANMGQWFFQYLGWGLSFWYGITLVLNERDLPPDEIVYDVENMITIFLNIAVAAVYFALTAPLLESFGMAKGAATKIFSIIASEPIINASKGNGLRPKILNGNITFENVKFVYPSRPNVQILQGLNLKVASGEIVALVGSSGCGKSTLVQLIQRFYDVNDGKVYIDDNEISELDLNWLRDHIGFVGQEPVLFETTIAQNIKYGCKTATQEEIENAAKKANAHTFITSLPLGYDTYVGERGTQLSGGQKQRIAIARALVRQPAILLLDEATSALDTKSEAVVQAALEEASIGRTTIIVAHRLSTVRKADRIVVISEGKVQEEGSHDELIAAKGAYYQLVTSQITAETHQDIQQIHYESGDDEVLESKETDVMVTNVLSNGLASTLEMAEEETETVSSSIWAILKYNSPEFWTMTVGCLSSIMGGMTMPIYSILFAYVVEILSNGDSEYVESAAKKVVLYFALLAVNMGLAMGMQTYMFGLAGEKLTMRLRSEMFKTMLNQEMAWFDEKNNGVGALCARLSGEAASVQGATGQRIGTILNAAVTIALSLGVAFYFEWRLTLVSLCLSAVYFLYLENKIVSKEITGHYKSLLKSTNIAVEAINGIRTVASLGCESTFVNLYMKEIIPHQKTTTRNSHFRGIISGIATSSQWFAYSAAFYYGGCLIRDEKLDIAPVFIVSKNIITSSWSLANAMGFTPNLQKGIISANRILKLLSRVPKITNQPDSTTENFETCNVEFEKITFSYPMRPNVRILNGLDLSVLEGKTVALVGHSGCGKSTIVQLLERFYDPSRGCVKTNGKDIRNINLSTLRSNLGIVSQEPNLFSKTIAENIAYGDNTRTVTMDEIMDAAKKANIHNFIACLPLGYGTKLGEKGTQLSGGQKQRIAIARALIRNPKVLLLDEATSALDAESEKVVQEALDNAKLGRTCITIAHRLSTVQDADVICVINEGKIAEIGTHSQLIGLKGLYYNLHKLQH